MASPRGLQHLHLPVLIPCTGRPGLGSACLSHSPAAAGPWRWAEQRGGEPSTMKVGTAPGWARCSHAGRHPNSRTAPLCPAKESQEAI